MLSKRLVNEYGNKLIAFLYKQSFLNNLKSKVALHVSVMVRFLQRKWENPLNAGSPLKLCQCCGLSVQILYCASFSVVKLLEIRGFVENVIVE